MTIKGWKHILVANWHIYEQHYCDNHKVVEYSEAWATSGLVSVLVPITGEIK